MNILVDIGHPAHVHFFRNFIFEMEKRGHKIVVTARKKDVVEDLLKHYEISYIHRGTLKGSMVHKAVDLPRIDIKLMRIIRRNKIDYVLGILNPYVAHSAFFTHRKAFTFNDTEYARLAVRLTKPFSTKILTPSCYQNNLGPKQVRYEGYHELAYLHPNRYKPDPGILDELGVNKGDRFAIVRFVSWAATHDVGHRGITLENKIKAVKKFSKLARVFITSEQKLPGELEKYKITIPPHRIHHALYYATLLFGESSTMASECAVLGTPAIFLDDVGRGYTFEEESKYGAVFNFTESEEDQRKAIEKGIEILRDDGIKKKWKEKRKQILADKIDVTAFMIDFIEGFHEKA
jgi:predicted glycosyltransferase